MTKRRSPAVACFADTLRTPAIMVEKGGSLYRTGSRIKKKKHAIRLAKLNIHLT